MENFKVTIVKLYMLMRKQNISVAFKMAKSVAMVDIIMAMEEYGKANGKTTDKMEKGNLKIKTEL